MQIVDKTKYCSSVAGPRFKQH